MLKKPILNGFEIKDTLGLMNTGPLIGKAAKFLLCLEEYFYNKYHKKITKEEAEDYLFKWYCMKMKKAH